MDIYSAIYQRTYLVVLDSRNAPTWYSLQNLYYYCTGVPPQPLSPVITMGIGQGLHVTGVQHVKQSSAARGGSTE